MGDLSNRMSKEIKQESSIPVQSRVSFMSLAKLHRYWIDEGYSIRTMSQLVSWSVDLICEVLEANGKMPGDINTLAKAHQYLQVHGLYQGSTKKLAMKKISTALRFESLREHGIDPKSHVPLQHKMVHKENSVRPLDCLVDSGTSGTSDEEWERIQRRIREEDEKDRIALVKAAVKTAKDSGLVVSEPEPEEPVMHSQEEVRAEFFKRAAKIKEEHPELNEKEVKARVQAEMKGEVFVPEQGTVVKEGMTDEEFMKRAKERDAERRKLENAPFEASDLPMVDKE